MTIIKDEILNYNIYESVINKDFFYEKQIFIDPCKKILLNMIDIDGNKLSYTNRQRIKKPKDKI